MGSCVAGLTYASCLEVAEVPVCLDDTVALLSHSLCHRTRWQLWRAIPTRNLILRLRYCQCCCAAHFACLTPPAFSSSIASLHLPLQASLSAGCRPQSAKNSHPCARSCTGAWWANKHCNTSTHNICAAVCPTCSQASLSACCSSRGHVAALSCCVRRLLTTLPPALLSAPCRHSCEPAAGHGA